MYNPLPSEVQKPPEEYISHEIGNAEISCQNTTPLSSEAQKLPEEHVSHEISNADIIYQSTIPSPSAAKKLPEGNWIISSTAHELPLKSMHLSFENSKEYKEGKRKKRHDITKRCM